PDAVNIDIVRASNAPRNSISNILGKKRLIAFIHFLHPLLITTKTVQGKFFGSDSTGSNFNDTNWFSQEFFSNALSEDPLSKLRCVIADPTRINVIGRL